MFVPLSVVMWYVHVVFRSVAVESAVTDLQTFTLDLNVRFQTLTSVSPLNPWEPSHGTEMTSGFPQPPPDGIGEGGRPCGAG